MEKLVLKLQHTGAHLAKERDRFLTRTKRAGGAMIAETRDAGRAFVASVIVEAKSWQRFVAVRATKLGDDVRGVVAPKAFEQRVLVSVGGTLRKIDARLQGRLASLEARPKRARRAATNGASKPRSGKAHTRTPATKTASAAAIAGAARH